MNKNLYLTDEQYLELLDMIENKLKNDSNFIPVICDDTTIGNKSTASNIGLCCEDFITLDMALFPDEFLKTGRKSKKYRLDNHACPFDNRVRDPHKKHGLMSLGGGCYYTCGLEAQKKLSKSEMLKYVADTRIKFLNGNLDKINEILKER